MRQNVFLLAGICLCVYFSWHAIQGSRSIIRLMQINSRIETMSLRHGSLAAARRELETNVAMMRPGSLDRDLAEERARVVLGYKGKNDLVVLRN